MKTKNIVTAVVLFLILSMGLLYGIPKLIPVEILEAYTGFFTPTLVYSVSCILSVGYLVLQYRARLTPIEIQAKKQEFYYNLFTDEQKQTFDTMSEEDKKRFIQACETNYFQDKRSEIYNKVFDWTHGVVPKALKPVRWVMICLMILSVGYVGVEGYQQMEPSITAYIALNNEPLPDGVYNFEGLPPVNIQVANGDEQANKKLVEDAMHMMLETQPKFLLQHCSIIHIYNSEKFNTLKPTQDAWAFATSEDNSINLVYGGNFGGSYSNAETTTHELCHLFDFAHGIEYTPEINSLYSNYAKNISDYATTNKKEFFAEAGGQYFHNPKQLQQNAPEVYNYLDQLFKPYMA